MKKHFFYIIMLTVGCLYFLSGCQQNHFNSLVIDDLIKLKQNHEDYLTGSNKNKLYIPKNYHKMIEKKYRTKLLSPWKTTKHSVKKQTLANDFERFRKKGGFGENKQKLNTNWISKIKKNANLKPTPTR